MTWTAHHHRAVTLQTVIDVANARQDGLLPLDVTGVAEHFEGELDLLGELQLKWFTELAGEIEHFIELMPYELESAVIHAWRATEAELPSVRAVLDHYTATPSTPEMARAMRVARFKDRVLLALMAGLASEQDAAGARIGRRIELMARGESDVVAVPAAGEQASLVSRLRAVLAA